MANEFLARALLAARGMSAFAIDVDAQVENLRGLKGDLEEYYWAHATAGGDGLRYGLGVAIAQLAYRITALEEIIRHHGGEMIAAADLTLDEIRTVENALDILDGEFAVEVELRQARLWTRVRSMLAAADDVLLVAARGQRVAGDGTESGPRPGVVLPLARSR